MIPRQNDTYYLEAHLTYQVLRTYNWAYNATFRPTSGPCTGYPITSMALRPSATNDRVSSTMQRMLAKRFTEGVCSEGGGFRRQGSMDTAELQNSFLQTPPRRPRLEESVYESGRREDYRKVLAAQRPVGPMRKPTRTTLCDEPWPAVSLVTAIHTLISFRQEDIIQLIIKSY